MSSFRSIETNQLTPSEIQKYLQGSVIPRPIGFASTIDSLGRVNLSPFSFFNCFGSNPPVLIFSPARRARNNSTKHTLENVKEIPEVVIGIVDYDMVEQMSLSSCEYPKGVNEFTKSGLSEIPSDIVRPPRVAECKVSFECVVHQVIETGTEGGAGNLVICHVKKLHLNEEIFDDKGNVDPVKLNAVSRLGGNHYLRISAENIFDVRKPVVETGIGADQIPVKLRKSGLLTGNEIGKLGNVPAKPTMKEISNWSELKEYNKKLKALNSDKHQEYIVKEIKAYLKENRTKEAWMLLSLLW